MVSKGRAVARSQCPTIEGYDLGMAMVAYEPRFWVESTQLPRWSCFKMTAGVAAGAKPFPAAVDELLELVRI